MRKIAISAFIVLSAVLVPSIGMVFAVEDIDDAIEQKEEERKQKESELEQSIERQYLYQQEGLTITEKLEALEKDLVNLNGDIKDRQKELARFEKQVEETSLILEETESDLGSVSKSLYKRSQMSLVEMIFSSGDISGLIRQLGFQRFGISHLLSEMRDFQKELKELNRSYADLDESVSSMKADLKDLSGEVSILENQKVAYAQMAAAESARQQALTTQIENITAEQQKLIEEKMAATQESTSIGEYEDVAVELPEPPFSPAFAVASIGYPHRVGLSQYGAYGRAKAGQNYPKILNSYYNAELVENYNVPERIYVVDYLVNGVPRSGWMDFEEQYLLGIAEMPTSWGDSGGFEALKAQAVIARSYAINFTQNGDIPICADQNCQVYNHEKASSPAAQKWHQAVEDTRGEVLISGNAVIAAYYASTAGGYTRLPTDFDVGWYYNPNFVKRTIDADSSGRAFDGPEHGDSPWYYKVWYAQSDVHPWLTEAEMRDLLNAALLPDTYNSHLSHPDLGGWSHKQVRQKLKELDIPPLPGVNAVTMINSDEGYVSKIRVNAGTGVREVDGIRFNNVYKLRSRGYLALWSSLYDIIVR